MNAYPNTRLFKKVISASIKTPQKHFKFRTKQEIALFSKLNNLQLYLKKQENNVQCAV